MKLPTAAYGALEIALNRYISSDERALAQCAALAGKSLQVDLTDLGLTLVYFATDHGLQVMAAPDALADVRLQGKSAAFARLFFAGAEEGLTGGAFRIEGDVGVAHKFARLFTSVDFDMADWLDARLGPLPAQFLSRGLGAAKALAGRAVSTLSRDTAEYLSEETRDVVGVREYAFFADEVDTLRADVGQMAARVRRLSRSGRR